MNFKDQLFHSSPFFSSNNILKFGGEITLENIIFVSKSIKRQVTSKFYDWFTFSGNLHRYEICWSITKYNILIFQHFEPKNMIILVYEQVLFTLGTIYKIR